MRRRWVQIDGKLVEVTRDYIQEPLSKDVGVLWNDRAYQDMGDPRFKSRSEHRAYMRANGLSTVDDYSSEWRNKEAERIKAKKGYDPTRKEDLIRAIETLNSRR